MVELAWVSKDGNAKIYHFTWSGLRREGNQKDEGVKRVHPTQKPVGLMAEIIGDYSKQKDMILDIFGGSGSTLIACEKTGRVCRMMELSPHYCDVIVRRWQEFSGQQAVHEATGKTFDEVAHG